MSKRSSSSGLDIDWVKLLFKLAVVGFAGFTWLKSYLGRQAVDVVDDSTVAEEVSMDTGRSLDTQSGWEE
jgi:hypothetical protein